MTADTLRVIPLGGLGEIGGNMMAMECHGDIVVVDAGILFPGADAPPGVDFAIPDTTYLRDNRERVRAILITHGHEDHIGALPYVLEELDVPIYSSRLAHGLISVKLRERGLMRTARLNVVEPHDRFRIGVFEIEFFRVCHSIPDAMGIAIDTPLGTVIHTGDFKIDHTPVDGEPMDFGALTRLAGDGALLLLSDSTYAEVEGYTESEQAVGRALDRLIGEAPGRVMVATFASLISRIQQVVDAAARHGRKVAVVGRSMANNTKMALNMGYLDDPDDTIIPLRHANQLPPERVVIVATGSQGEPTSALVRISRGEHRDVEVLPGDTVIISASPIPGNETLVARTIDDLFRQGASVYYSRVAMVHVHGHAAREELKLMLRLTRPRYFVPVHGEYRHLVAHAALARETGVAAGNAFVLTDGQVLEIDAYGAEVAGRVQAGSVYVNGRTRWAADSEALEHRRRLGRRGIVAVALTVDDYDGYPLYGPLILSSGYVEVEEGDVLFPKTAKVALQSLEGLTPGAIDWDMVRRRVTDDVTDFLYQQTRRRPMVLLTIRRL